MNILLVASDNSLVSGAFNSMAVLAKNMIKDGNKVMILVPRKGDGTLLLDKLNIPYVYIRSINWVTLNKKRNYVKKVMCFFKNLYNIIPFFKIKNIISKEKIQIVHMNTSWTYIAALSAFSKKTKVVWHIREFLEEDQNKKILFKKVGYKIINKADKIICISDSIKTKYENYLDTDKLVKVFNGIDVDKYKTNKKGILNKTNVNILCVGNVNEKKGQFEVADVVCQINKENKIHLNLMLVGECPDYSRKKIREIQKKYGIDCIEILGKQKNVIKYYEKADIFVMNSVSEAFGRVTIEAMLCKCFVLGRKSSATSEIIENGKNGFLYNSKEELKKQIIEAINNDTKTNSIVLSAHDIAKEKFNSIANSNNIEKIYSEILY